VCLALVPVDFPIAAADWVVVGRAAFGNGFTNPGRVGKTAVRLFIVVAEFAFAARSASIWLIAPAHLHFALAFAGIRHRDAR